MSLMNLMSKHSYCVKRVYLQLYLLLSCGVNSCFINSRIKGLFSTLGCSYPFFYCSRCAAGEPRLANMGGVLSPPHLLSITHRKWSFLFLLFSQGNIHYKTVYWIVKDWDMQLYTVAPVLPKDHTLSSLEQKKANRNV